MTCHEAGRLDEAQALYRGILARESDHAESLHLLGLITAQNGDPEEGAALIRHAMALTPGRGPHHNNLALAYHLLGRDEDAVREYRTAAALLPGSAEIQNNLATILRDLGRRDEALAHYRRAAERAPESADIWYNLANALADASAAAEEVESCFRHAVKLRPDFAKAYGNYGRWLLTRGHWALASTLLTQATRLAPAHAPAWSNLGIALQELGRTAAAEACYRRAARLDRGLADAQYNLGCLLHGQGRTDDAVACQLAALAADPGHGRARLAFAMAQLPILYHTQIEVDARRRRYGAALQALAAAEPAPEQARALADAIGSTQPTFLPYQGEDDRTLQSLYGTFACRVLAATAPALPPPPRPAPGARIRLGIVSGFFCDHTIFKLFLEGWLTQLDRDRFRGDRLPHRPDRGYPDGTGGVLVRPVRPRPDLGHRVAVGDRRRRAACGALPRNRP